MSKFDSIVPIFKEMDRIALDTLKQYEIKLKQERFQLLKMVEERVEHLKSTGVLTFNSNNNIYPSHQPNELFLKEKHAITKLERISEELFYTDSPCDKIRNSISTDIFPTASSKSPFAKPIKKENIIEDWQESNKVQSPEFDNVFEDDNLTIQKGNLINLNTSTDKAQSGIANQDIGRDSSLSTLNYLHKTENLNSTKHTIQTLPLSSSKTAFIKPFVIKENSMQYEQESDEMQFEEEVVFKNGILINSNANFASNVPGKIANQNFKRNVSLSTRNSEKLEITQRLTRRKTTFGDLSMQVKNKKLNHFATRDTRITNLQKTEIQNNSKQSLKGYQKEDTVGIIRLTTTDTQTSRKVLRRTDFENSPVKVKRSNRSLSRHTLATKLPEEKVNDISEKSCEGNENESTMVNLTTIDTSVILEEFMFSNAEIETFLSDKSSVKEERTMTISKIFNETSTNYEFTNTSPVIETKILKTKTKEKKKEMERKVHTPRVLRSRMKNELKTNPQAQSEAIPKLKKPSTLQFSLKTSHKATPSKGTKANPKVKLQTSSKLNTSSASQLSTKHTERATPAKGRATGTIRKKTIITKA